MIAAPLTSHAGPLPTPEAGFLKANVASLDNKWESYLWGMCKMAKVIAWEVTSEGMWDHLTALS